MFVPVDHLSEGIRVGDLFKLLSMVRDNMVRERLDVLLVGREDDQIAACLYENHIPFGANLLAVK